MEIVGFIVWIWYVFLAGDFADLLCEELVLTGWMLMCVLAYLAPRAFIVWWMVLS